MLAIPRRLRSRPTRFLAFALVAVTLFLVLSRGTVREYGASRWPTKLGKQPGAGWPVKGGGDGRPPWKTEIESTAKFEVDEPQPQEPMGPPPEAAPEKSPEDLAREAREEAERNKRAEFEAEYYSLER
jgi:nitrate reductase NapE component